MNFQDFEKTDYCGVSLIVDGKEVCRTPEKNFTAPPVLNMFDHLENNGRLGRGKIFKLKWNKDHCERRNHMFAQVGPISIAYQGKTIISKNILSIYNIY